MTLISRLLLGLVCGLGLAAAAAAQDLTAAPKVACTPESVMASTGIVAYQSVAGAAWPPVTHASAVYVDQARAVITLPHTKVLFVARNKSRSATSSTPAARMMPADSGASSAT